MRIHVAILAIALSIPSLTQAITVGRIKDVVGEAHVERSGAMLDAKPGLALQPQDIVRTKAASRVGITFIDNSRFAVGPSTELELASFRFNATTHEGEFLTKLNRGKLAVTSGQIAKRSKEAMRVRTPASILGVRGTRFLIEVSD